VLAPGDTGLLLDDPQPQETAKALRRLIRDPDLRRRLGTAAADHARAQFDPLRNARAVESVYDSLLGIRSGPAPAEPATPPRSVRVAAS
jgi:glycosyltransferase involved in cell wall biosynthesis